MGEKGLLWVGKDSAGSHKGQGQVSHFPFPKLFWGRTPDSKTLAFDFHGCTNPD